MTNKKRDKEREGMSAMISNDMRGLPEIKSGRYSSQYFSVRDVSEILNVSAWTVRKLIRNNQLKRVMISGRWMIERREISRYRVEIRLLSDDKSGKK